MEPSIERFKSSSALFVEDSFSRLLGEKYMYCHKEAF